MGKVRLFVRYLNVQFIGMIGACLPRTTLIYQPTVIQIRVRYVHSNYLPEKRIVSAKKEGGGGGGGGGGILHYLWLRKLLVFRYLHGKTWHSDSISSKKLHATSK